MHLYFLQSCPKQTILPTICALSFQRYWYHQPHCRPYWKSEKKKNLTYGSFEVQRRQQSTGKRSLAIFKTNFFLNTKFKHSLLLLIFWERVKHSEPHLNLKGGIPSPALVILWNCAWLRLRYQLHNPTFNFPAFAYIFLLVVWLLSKSCFVGVRHALSRALLLHLHCSKSW